MVKESKKKVLYIITKSVWAGASKYVYDLATSLPQARFGAIVAGGGRGVMSEKIISAGIPYFEIKGFQRDVNFLKDIFAFSEILALLFKTKPDVIHVSSAKAGGIAGVAIFIYKIIKKLKTTDCQLKTVFTVHGWTFSEPRPRWQIALIKIFSKLTCLFYDKIICVSKYDYGIGLKNKIVSAKKMVVIHNGIKPSDYVFSNREEARSLFRNHFPCDRDGETSISPKIWIGTVGEFTKNKGQKYLVEAVKKLKGTNYKLQTVLIGFDGGEKSNLKSQIKSGAVKNVFLIENMPDAARHLKAFDIFILPSLKEGLPYTLLEAGLAELPIIATDIGGIPEIIENEKTGLLVKSADADKLAEAIKKLITDTELQNKLGANARQKILQEFSMGKMLDETIALYK